jgi:3D (Asp-Asp-Asp) domain-containing protein
MKTVQLRFCRRFLMVSVATLSVVILAACAARQAPPPVPTKPLPAPPAPVTFTATAYCQGTTTATGTKVRRGIVAADPVVLPLGSLIQVRGLAGGLDGVYTVADTGPKVRGRSIDIYMTDCRAAVRFGRQRARVTVLRPRS